MQAFIDELHDGWRAFATRRESVSWMRLRRHLGAMPDAGFVDLACDRMNEAAMIFIYRGHRFGVDVHDGRFRFSVEDRACPNEVLGDVIRYVDQLVSASDH